MRLKWWILTCCLSPIFILSGCLIGTDLVRDTVKGDYCIWAMEAESQTQFIRANDGSAWPGTTLVEATVVKAGWDNQWLLLEQFPQPRFASSNKIGSKRQFYIFRFSDEKLFGPYSHKVFLQQRIKLGVPSALDLNRRYAE